MKLHLAIIFSIASISSAWSCTIVDSTTNNVRDVVSARGGYKITDSQCELLNRNKLSLNIVGSGSVLNGVNAAWAVVSLQDQKFNITSDKVGRSTIINRDTASQDVADDILYEAISNAIESLDWKNAANEVAKYRAAATKK